MLQILTMDIGAFILTLWVFVDKRTFRCKEKKKTTYNCKQKTETEIFALNMKKAKNYIFW